MEKGERSGSKGKGSVEGEIENVVDNPSVVPMSFALFVHGTIQVSVTLPLKMNKMSISLNL